MALAQPATMMVVLRDPDRLGVLGQQLLQDRDGRVRDEYGAYFQDALLQEKRKLLQPLPADEFERSNALAECTALATDVITAVWQAMHSGS